MGLIKKGRLVDRDNVFDVPISTTGTPNNIVQANGSGKISHSLLNTTTVLAPNAILQTDASGTIDNRIIAQSLYTTKTFYVNQVSGSDTNDGMSPSTAFKTLQKAFDQGCPGAVIEIVLTNNYTMSPITEKELFAKTGRYVFDLNNFTLTASIYTHWVAGYNGITTIKSDGQVTIFVIFKNTGKIVIPSSSLPIAPSNNSLFGVSTYAGYLNELNIHIDFSGSSSGTQAMSISSGSFVAVHTWDDSVGAILRVSCYPHYHRIIDLYGPSSFLVNYAGRSGGSLGVFIGNNTFSSYIRRDNSNISISSAISGVTYTSGVPVNITLA